VDRVNIRGDCARASAATPIAHAGADSTLELAGGAARPSHAGTEVQNKFSSVVDLNTHERLKEAAIAVLNI
jgi:hypothetical protein